MERFICIHGHFYQPPRENPWLEAVELQDSASPYHDWNERITAECYAPNSCARRLNAEGRIQAIVNNYAWISFNFGPTLLAWMQHQAPDIHGAIVEADRKSREHFSGHGSALAQAYNHMILPLANRRDKVTQVLWGIRDFEWRFGRKPEGMWLAETAVDTETLEVLAEQNLRFTVLSPFQAARIRELGGRNWRDVNGGRIDPTRAYLARLPSGRSIHLFFYDGPVSQAVAFERLLDSGEKFAGRLMSAFSDKRSWNQLVHIATDGESYGHHHKHGEMALAYALHYLQAQGLARLTVYGEYLERHPATHQVQIHEGSAWSCSHGVGRWKEHCGCHAGGRPGWTQAWRGPLREALDALRDRLAPLYEARCGELLKSPWEARNDYISVLLDRSPENVQRFFERHACRPLTASEQVTALKLLELQRHAMLQYTSCGWFFDELSGLETVQVIQYAGRAVQLAQEVLHEDLEPEFLEHLERAPSNLPEHRNGRSVYLKFVKPAMISWKNVVAHYAVSSLFRDYQGRARIFLYQFEDEDRQVFTAGRARLAVGRARVTFEITQESVVLSYAVLYLGEHNLTGGIKAFDTMDQHREALEGVRRAFESAEFPEVIRAVDRLFDEGQFSLKSLFKDEQRNVLNEILASTRADLESRYRLISERYTPLLRFIRDLGAPPPEALSTATRFILHVDLCRQFEADKADLAELQRLLQEAREQQLNLADPELAFLIQRRLEINMRRVLEQPGSLEELRELEALTAVVSSLPADLNLWRVQNDYDQLLHREAPVWQERRARGEPEAAEWLDHFACLGRHLGFSLEQLPS